MKILYTTLVFKLTMYTHMYYIIETMNLQTVNVKSTMASSLDHSIPDSANNSAVIAGGVSGVFLLVLLTSLTVALIIGIGILKRKKSVKVESSDSR